MASQLTGVKREHDLPRATCDQSLLRWHRSLWPRTAIATAAVANLLGGAESVRRSRRPEIMADAAIAILCSPPASCS